MPYLSEDAYGHRNKVDDGTQGVALVGAAVSTTAKGTIVGTTAAGAAPTITFATGQSAHDTAGTFTLNPVTGGGAQAAGAVAQIFFNQPFGAVPTAVLVNVVDQAAGSSAVAVAASSSNVLTTGFTVNVSAALTTAHNYSVSYSVIA